MSKFLQKISQILIACVIAVSGVLSTSPIFAATVSSAPTTSTVVVGFVREQNATDHAWFIDPKTRTRAFIGSPADALAVIQHFAVGFTNQDIQKIPFEGSSSITTPTVFQNTFRGSILLQVENKGAAWYVSQDSGLRFALGTPQEAFNIILKRARVIDKNALKPIAVSLFSPSWLVLPTGYKADVVATGFITPRVLAWDPSDHLVVTEHNNKSGVFALLDTDHDGKFETKKALVHDLLNGHGVAFAAGRMYVAKEHWVEYWNYDAKNMKVVGNSTRILALQPGTGFFAGQGHKTRTLVLGNDNHLYLAIGSPCDSCINMDGFKYAAILRMDLDGKNVETFARGLRNTVFFTQNPFTGMWWGNDMGQDNLGDDLPPDEINNIVQGRHYGWPYCYFNQQPTPANPQPQRCSTTTSPSFTYPAHSAPLGIRVIPAAFKDAWKNDFLSALHGSTVRKDKLVGYRIVHVINDAKGNPTRMEDAITGFLRPGNVIVSRPVDILFAKDGTLYITDDYANVVHRVQKK